MNLQICWLNKSLNLKYSPEIFDKENSDSQFFFLIPTFFLSIFFLKNTLDELITKQIKISKLATFPNFPVAV